MTARASEGRPARKARVSVPKKATPPPAHGLGAHKNDFACFFVMAPIEQARQIREGMEAVITERVAKELLRIPLQALLTSLRLPSSTILRKIANRDRLSGSESDRIARVVYVFEQAKDVFEDEADASGWLQRPNALLDGQRPLDVLDTQPGYDRVRDILVRLEQGVGA
jgi:putative toxin-antitoxin system antitoxin component (TIGR02293 family)